MGAFLNMNTSTKNNPNENYPREIMQLFSIGTDLLNQDGSTQNDPITGAAAAVLRPDGHRQPQARLHGLEDPLGDRAAPGR